MEYTTKYENVVSSIITVALNRSLLDTVRDFQSYMARQQTEREYVELIKIMIKYVSSQCQPWDFEMKESLDESIPVLDFILNTKLPPVQTLSQPTEPTLRFIRQEGNYLIYSSTSAQGVQTLKSDSILSCWQDAVDRYSMGGVQIL